MDQLEISLTAVFLRSSYGYVGFVEELPSINSNGHTIEETRVNLRRAAQTIFDLERTQARELLAGKDVVRENFSVSG
jgi:predicted RNase H-like HicB family nuclease